MDVCICVHADHVNTDPFTVSEKTNTQIIKRPKKIYLTPFDFHNFSRDYRKNPTVARTIKQKMLCFSFLQITYIFFLKKSFLCTEKCYMSLCGAITGRCTLLLQLKDECRAK